MDGWDGIHIDRIIWMSNQRSGGSMDSNAKSVWEYLISPTYSTDRVVF